MRRSAQYNKGENGEVEEEEEEEEDSIVWMTDKSSCKNRAFIHIISSSSQPTPHPPIRSRRLGWRHHHESPPTLSSPTAATTLLKLPPTGTNVYVIVFTSVFSLLLLLALFYSSPSSAVNPPIPDPFLFPDPKRRIPAGSSPPSPPSIVYFVSGTAGQSSRIVRLLLSLYHPKNYYLLHLDRIARDSERELLADSVRRYEVFRAAHNVEVLGKADFAYAKGSSPVSAMLRGAAVALRLGWSWDWFICMGALDYPLVTQDDLLHILSYMPKDLNFMNHTSYIGWRESRKLKPIIVDPGLYIAERTEMFYASQKRDLPDAYTLFTGPSFNILSRSFVEFLILGTDNFPRTLLMYMANTPYSFSSYFPTVLCNSRQFNKTVINHNLLYTTFFKSERWKKPLLSSSDFDDMTASGAAFASPFSTDESILDRIDSEILGRSSGQVLLGGWCLGGLENDTCSTWGDANILRPGPGARRLEKLLVKLLSNGTFLSQQCTIAD